MEWNIKYSLDEHLIYVKTKGILTVESANLMVEDIVKAAACHQCDNQIVDHRETTFALQLFEYYERPEVNSKIGISPRWNIAMIFKELTSNTLFMETVFRNRGYNFCQFDDIGKARKWVLSQ
ncbi:MAG: hypothetical protein IPO22_15670 [Anaerolineales bacterium]|nr:hypothetical protein [Anaerolineales bacterium]